VSKIIKFIGLAMCFSIPFTQIILAKSPTATTSPLGIVGYWETLDNKTNKPAGILKIWRDHGKFYGKIVKSYTECSSKPSANSSVGKTILRDLQYRKGSYVNGRIVDPRSGDDYSVRVRVVNNGEALQVRGFLGIALLGKTMVWPRVSNVKGKMKTCMSQV